MPTTPVSKDFKVAIVGGGMCGIVCAIGLTRCGISVAVFEAAAKFDEVGAGVGLGPNALRALDSLGLLEAILLKADEPKPTPRPFLVVSGTGEHEQIYDFVVSPDDAGLGIYRPAFLEALMPLIEPGITHFNKRCTSISAEPSGGHTVHFSDGTTYSADLVIGADGIKSVTRNALPIPEDGPGYLAFTNTVAYRGLVSTETLTQAGVKTNLAPRPLSWVGLDKHIITFPIQRGQMINIVAFVTNRKLPINAIERQPPWVEAVAQQEMLDEFSDWGSDAIIILKHLEKPSKWYIHAMDPPLPSYVHRKVVLVGDAAHAMPPHLGAGAGQGFEDVLVLCRLLGHSQTNISNLEAVLQVYNSIRPPRANMVLDMSKRTGDIWENYWSGGYNKEQMREILSGIWGPVWHHNIDAEVTAAIEKMQGCN